MKHLLTMLALQQTAAVVLKRAAAATPQAFERATGLRVLHMSPAVVVVDKPTGLRSVPAYGPTRALLADFARRRAAGEADLQAKFERPTRRDRWFVLSVISELFRAPPRRPRRGRQRVYTTRE